LFKFESEIWTFRPDALAFAARSSQTLCIDMSTQTTSFNAQIQAMKDHGGLILNISSAYGFVPNPFEPIYSASKGN